MSVPKPAAKGVAKKNAGPGWFNMEAPELTGEVILYSSMFTHLLFL